VDGGATPQCRRPIRELGGEWYHRRLESAQVAAVGSSDATHPDAVGHRGDYCRSVYVVRRLRACRGFVNQIITLSNRSCFACELISRLRWRRVSWLYAEEETRLRRHDDHAGPALR